jgi:hypothetical protein
MAESSTAMPFAQFVKRGRYHKNLETFWTAVDNGEFFQLVKPIGGELNAKLKGICYKIEGYNDKGKKVKICQDYICSEFSNAKAFADAVEGRVPTDARGTDVQIIADDDKYYGFGYLHKATKFGGGGSSSRLDTSKLKWGQLGVYAEACNYKLLPPGKQIELDWMNDFNEKLTKAIQEIREEGDNPCMDVEIAGVTIPNCIGTMGAPGANRDPKADVVFVSCDGDCLSYSGYASLKDGTKAKDFQQWGGLSAYSDHPEVEAFVDALKAQYPNGAPSGMNIGRRIEDDSLKIKAIFGPEYRPNQYDSESCQLVIQGFTKRFRRAGNKLIFESESDHVYSDSPQGKAHLLSESNGTAPVFMARRGDRSDFDVPRTRIFIYSIEGRTNWNWI